MRSLIRTIGTFARPARALVDWATCELLFGELMGAAILASILFAWFYGFTGFAIVAIGYFVALAVFMFLGYAIHVRDQSES